MTIHRNAHLRLMWIMGVAAGHFKHVLAGVWHVARTRMR